MPQVTLNVPVLVHQLTIDGSPSFHLRPVFLDHPVATHRRYEQAVNVLKQEIHQYFRQERLDRLGVEKLLWLTFQPDLQLRQIPFSGHLGRQYVSGKFTVLDFRLGRHAFQLFPAFDNYLSLLEGEGHSRAELKTRAEETLEALLKNIRKEQGNHLEVEDFVAPRREFLTTVETNIRIGAAPIKFDQRQERDFFRQFLPDTDFDGGEEIEKVSFDLNQLYPGGLQRAFYRDELATRLQQIIYQAENTPLVLIGAEGAGKHTLLHEVIRRYLSETESPTQVRRQRLWHLDPTRVIAGMSIVGLWEKRFEAILRHVRQPTGKAGEPSDKLLVDNPIALLEIGRSAQNDLTLANVLKPYLEKRLLQLILIATPEQWKIVQERDRSFSDLFQVVRLPASQPEEALRIALRQRRRLELENQCQITIQAVRQLFNLQRNYLPHKALPGSVMKLMRQLATKYRGFTVDAPEVRQEFQDLSGLRERIFDESMRLEEAEVEKVIGRELVGQPEAVRALADAINAVKAKLNNPDRPLASFLLIGPTGVGKTQAAKVLCRYLTGNERQLMRFDMNEYIDETAVQRLIGDYYNPEGQLSGKVRYQPFGVVLLDEVEKAHPKVLDLLLQVLDDGRLSDSRGRTVDFTNTIVIMTSNLGAREVASQLGFQTARREEAQIYRKAIENHFRPEFINRIDQVVIFHALKFEHILNIAHLQIRELLQRDGFVRRTTLLNISQEALEWVARRGFDARMGGRALRRQIERDLTALSAEQLISTYSENPILLDIEYRSERLYPRITPLEFAEPLDDEWLPELPDEKDANRFFRRLMRAVESIEKQILQQEESSQATGRQLVVSGEQGGAQLNWQYYDFKNRVAQVKEDLNTLLLGFRDPYFREGPAIPFRLKNSALIPRSPKVRRAEKASYRDRLFQQEALLEIAENYQFAQLTFDSMKTEFLHSYLTVVFLRLQARGFFRNRSDQVRIQLSSCISGLGKDQIDYLLDRYGSMLTALEIPFQRAAKENWIEAEYHGLYDLLRGEEGLHLFYLSHQNPIPLRVEVFLKDKQRKQTPSFRVLRIYDEGSTLSDLRTELTNAIHISGEEFRVLIYGGLSNDLRRELAP